MDILLTIPILLGWYYIDVTFNVVHFRLKGDEFKMALIPFKLWFASLVRIIKS